MNERISLVVKESGLTKTAFAQKINVSQSLVSMICAGTATPSDRTISDICREFSVNELWLREGVGDMFVTLSREDKILSYVASLVKNKDADFQRWILSLFADLPPETWSVIEQKVKELLEAQKKEAE